MAYLEDYAEVPRKERQPDEDDSFADLDPELAAVKLGPWPVCKIQTHTLWKSNLRGLRRLQTGAASAIVRA